MEPQLAEWLGRMSDQGKELASSVHQIVVSSRNRDERNRQSLSSRQKVVDDFRTAYERRGWHREGGVHRRSPAAIMKAFNMVVAIFF